jgi:hypothetical protein
MPKEIPDQYFPNLDMITSLLASKPTGKPAIEVISSYESAMPDEVGEINRANACACVHVVE